MAYQNVIEAPYWSTTGVTDQQLMRYTPSVLQTQAWSETTDQYKVIATGDILATLRRQGFAVQKAMQARSMTSGKRPFTKHSLTLVRIDELGKRNDKFTITLVNSFDATSAYWLYLGYIRFVCSNGLVFGDLASKMRVLHRGTIGDIVESTCTLIDKAEQVTPRIEAMRARVLRPEESIAFAEYALQLRFGEKNPGYTVWDVLHRNRQADQGSNLWLTYNVLQENLIKGFYARKNYSIAKSRVVRSVDADIDYNVGLWDKALSYLG